MKVILIIFLYFSIRVSSASTLKRIESVHGAIAYVDFDGEGNTYVLNGNDYYNNSTSHLKIYKLSPSNELLWAIDLQDYTDITAMDVTRQGDVYFISQYEGSDSLYLNFIWANSTEIKKFDELSKNFVWNANDNLFYCKSNAGMHVIRANSSFSTPITMLENICLLSHFAYDRLGNIYFLVDSSKYHLPGIALITEEALQQEIPQASFINASDSENQTVNGFIVDYKNYLWIAIQEKLEGGVKKGLIKKYVNGKFETILTDQDYPYIFLDSACKDKIFVIASNGQVSKIYYFTLNNERVEIPELNNITGPGNAIGGQIDNECFAYFMHNKGDKNASLIHIKPNEKTPVIFDFQQEQITDWNLDFDLWIAKETGLYRLQKGERSVDIVKTSCGAPRIFSNSVTKKVFVSCINNQHHELFVVIND